MLGMRAIVPIQALRIAKRRGCFLERDAVLLKVCDRLSDVPREHDVVYTEILG